MKKHGTRVRAQATMSNTLAPVERRTLRDWIKELSPAQLRAILASLGALVATSFAVGSYFQPLVNKSLSRPRTCSDMANYPLGLWLTKGVKIRQGRADTTVGDELGEFTKPASGVWFAGLGRERPDGNYEKMELHTFSADVSPKPGRQVHVHAENPGEKYVGESVLTVSDDGCMMVGDFKGFLDGRLFIAGYAAYCWQFAERCVLPTDNEGWRAPNVYRTISGPAAAPLDTAASGTSISASAVGSKLR